VGPSGIYFMLDDLKDMAKDDYVDFNIGGLLFEKPE
jgi:hypothetical protein